MKQQIRQRILDDIKSIKLHERVEKSIAIQQNLKKVLKDEAGLWAGFNSLQTEPQIQWEAVSEKVQWCFPVATDSTQLQFKKSVKNNKISSLGVLEPIDGEDVSIHDVNGVVLPGVAFGKNGNRLGRGKGYYDRTLEKFSGKKIGICFEIALIDDVPTSGHDIKCDFIVTENHIYNALTTKGDSKWN